MTVNLDVPDLNVTPTNEVFVRFGPDQRLTGILSGVGGNGCTLLLPSAGLQPRAGPFRMHVLLADRLARQGIRCFRYDVPAQPKLAEAQIVLGEVPVTSFSLLERRPDDGLIVVRARAQGRY